MKELPLRIYPVSLYMTTELKEYNDHVDIGERDKNAFLGVTNEYINTKRVYNKGVIICFNIEQITTLHQLVMVITHETRHASDMFYSMLGMKGSLKDDEFGAHLQGYLAEECMKYIENAIKNKKLKADEQLRKKLLAME